MAVIYVMSSYNKLISMVFKPFAGSTVVRIYRFYLLPKIFRVVHISQMAQLMDDHIVRDCGRRQHEPPVKRESAARAAASPAGFLVPDADAVIGTSGKLMEVSDAFWKILFCSSNVSFFQSGSLDIGQVGDRAVIALFFRFQIFGDNPDALLDEEVFNFFFCDIKRDADCNLSFRVNTDGAAFTAAADKCVGQFIELTLILNSDSVFGVVHWISHHFFCAHYNIGGKKRTERKQDT